MLILLPPSEGKTPAPAGAGSLDLDALSHPGLTAQRETVLDTLAAVSAAPEAAAALGVGASLAHEVARNTRLRTEPVAQARLVYSGVLYDAAGLASLTPRAVARAAESVRTVSALWGLVSPTDPIPAYRLSMSVPLPGVGDLARSWRQHLAAELDPLAAHRLVVDCRSAAYAAAWRPTSTAHGWVSVRVEREVAGRRSVVSHHAKHTRGVLTRHLLTRRGEPPATPGQLLRASRSLVGSELTGVELSRGPRGAHTLTLVVG